MSKKDQRRNIAGDRSYYEDKDLCMDPQRDPITSRHVLISVDVDYFLPMDVKLLQHDNSFLLYTVIPESVASNGATNHTFHNNVFTERIPGGSVYSHSLWDYSPDVISVRGWKNLWTHTWKMYKVEKRQVSPNRAVVLLQLSWSKEQNLVSYVYSLLRFAVLRSTQLVTRKIYRLLGIACDASANVGELKHTLLKRLQPLEGEFNVLRLVETDGIFYSIGRNNSHAHARIPATLFDTLRAAQNIQKQNMLKSTVESYLPPGESRKFDSAILTDYLTNGTPNMHTVAAAAITRTDNGIATYQCESEYGYDKDAPPSIVPIMPTILGDCPSPANCIANDDRCVRGRITDIGHKKPLVLTTFEQKAINEFVTYASSGLNLEPSDYETVWERQGRPTQRTILGAADNACEMNAKPIRCFMKKESYGKITDPRNIAQLPPKLKAAYSRFTYALADAVKKHPHWNWYGFGKTPIEVANKVASICSKAKKYVHMTDFSRMDGRKSNVGRTAWAAFLLQSFSPQYHEEIADLFSRQIDVRAVTAHGIFFETGFSQLSGSPDTSLSNSFETALTVYVAMRKAHIEADEAIAMMQTHVVAGGDDGLVADIAPTNLVKSARAVGHVLTLETANLGLPGVNFLSRYYSPEVWVGHNTSICDVRRQLMKIHTTPRGGLDFTKAKNRRAKLIEKCRALALTDANTPVLGDLARVVMLASDTTPHSSPQAWWSQYERKDQFPQDPPGTSWMIDHVKTRIPGYNYEAHIKAIEEAKINDLVDLNRPGAEFMDKPLLFSAPGVVVMTGMSATLAREEAIPIGKQAPAKETKLTENKPATSAKRAKPSEGKYALRSHIKNKTKTKGVGKKPPLEKKTSDRKQTKGTSTPSPLQTKKWEGKTGPRQRVATAAPSVRGKGRSRRYRGRGGKRPSD
jgi:hypothetical protein